MKKTILWAFVAGFVLVGCRSPQVIKTYNEDTTRTVKQEPVIGTPVDAQKSSK